MCGKIYLGREGGYYQSVRAGAKEYRYSSKETQYLNV